MSKFTLGRNWRAASHAGFFMMLVLLLTTACTRREAFPEDSEEPIEVAEGEEAPAKYDGVLLAQVVFDSVDYIVDRKDLLQPFIKEFGDGTVVDKVMIRKVQETKADKPAYYLVGLGIRNGAFRSMALQLDIAADNSLYLSSKNPKFMCHAGPGCDFCYFTFAGNKITGCECSARAAGNNCAHKVSETNSLLSNSRLREVERSEQKPKPLPKP
ncbi:hypothetical protein ABID22_002974 [Pontibacter aydingkolensis]|uniref:SWIM-type domain-containing protein n=1 Tax=Pontibacter aydingkolensis TaxID=1911536 RepID=A0ABS7CUJ0_9BACT|nr:hypothetical protein [Pontibacter aydingkolensis]MBW7467513.1 hypothetical protein [Pontibacter aydingkolensis]